MDFEKMNDESYALEEAISSLRMAQKDLGGMFVGYREDIDELILKMERERAELETILEEHYKKEDRIDWCQFVRDTL